MCGIAGVVNRHAGQAAAPELCRAMADAIAHRGPDGEGMWIGDGTALIHRRLSIIDLAGGAQPIANEDGTVQVVCNGEIYNYQQLAAELISRGHVFRTKSDTEVLVHLYEECGAELVHRLRGMFALAIWDARRGELLLARDRVGQKPLYYYHDDQQFLFASEPKAILAHAAIERKVDLEALEQYLTFGFVPSPRSIFRGMQKLPAGHTLRLHSDRRHLALQRYWALDVPTADAASKTESQWLEAFDNKLQETVAAHLVADVPVGAFLSGGLDSSTIVARVAEQRGQPPATFSIGFDETDFSELPYARQVSKQFGTRHSEQIIRPEAAHCLEELTAYFDEPFADTSAIAMLCLARLTSQHVKVALSGDGGDEALGGYMRYAHDLREHAVRRLLPDLLRHGLLRPLAAAWPQMDWLPRPLRLRSTLANLANDAAGAYANTLSQCRLGLRHQLLNGDVRRQLAGSRPERCITQSFGESGDPLRRMIACDVAVLLPDDFLTKVDRATMAYGLEARPPLVDHELLELAIRIPSSLKVQGSQTKYLLKRVMDERLPRDVVWRAKRGFELPIDGWLRGPLLPVVEDMLLSHGARISEWFDLAVVRRLVTAHRRGHGRHGAVLWSLLVLEQWARHYLAPAQKFDTRPTPAIAVAC